MKQNYNPLTEGKISRVILRFALPFMAASLIQALYGAVDLYVVGQYTGSSAVSAVAIGSQVMLTLTGVILGISTGRTVLLGNRIGAKDNEGSARAVGNLSFLFACTAVLLTPIFLLLTQQIIIAMQTPSEAVGEACTYLRICSMGIPFIVGYNGVSGIFRGIGDSKTPVIFVLIACAFNVAGDFLLTGAMDLGAAGAAISTSAAQGISFLISLIYLRKKGFLFPLHWRHFHPVPSDLIHILRIGFPIALQDALANISFLIITAIVNTLGLTASAAVGVVERLLGFAFLIPSGFSSAVAIMVAQNNGAGQPRRAWRSLWFGVGYAMAAGVCICLLCNAIPEVLASIFSKDPAVITAAGQFIRLYSTDCILTGFVFCANSYFTACDRAYITFGQSIIATLLVRIPATWFLSKLATESLLVMGLAAPLASTLAIVIHSFFLLRRREQRRLDFREKG